MITSFITLQYDTRREAPANERHRTSTDKKSRRAPDSSSLRQAPLPPASLFTPTPKAARRVLEFFTARINNPHTRRAYLSAARRFDAYLKNSGTLETAQHIANHESPRTTKLYDRRQEEISLDEVERIAI